MATVYLTLAAEIDIDRLSDYLQDYAGDEAAKNFADLIEKGMSILSETPLLAGYSGLSNEYHELLIRANKKRHYRLLYEYDTVADTVKILAVKDAREKGFTGFN